MTEESPIEWRADFGIDRENYPNFFSSKAELTANVPQAHVVRQAFDLLDLDGVLCQENAPLVYFKRVSEIGLQETLLLHRQFWNHGGAPILVLISPRECQVHSGMLRPESPSDVPDRPSSLVAKLDRAAAGIQQFIISVETGEFFRRHSKSFDPDSRVDRDLLANLRDARDVLHEKSASGLNPSVLDALLCRVVFTCYLFDRHVINKNYLNNIGIPNAGHLRELLSDSSSVRGKDNLYRLFRKLGDDFNGDLFSDDLDAEEEFVSDQHIKILGDFFQGTNVRTGQRSFWPYDFGFIPIETISAIYEHFLKAEDQRDGAFYTPRFLAEIVLDSALEGFGTLLGKRFLDPACGSGIFLVGLFNRMAEEWTQKNPNARNERRATELMRLLRESLFGVDKNQAACRITAFSLYLAYLDKLSPRDIQGLQKRGRALPHLVIHDATIRNVDRKQLGQNIKCTDFFIHDLSVPTHVDLVIGNPPWGSTAGDNTPAGKWCAEFKRPLPDKQIAAAFIWKVADHVSVDGRICFVLPHGTLFNHGRKAVEFQEAWIRSQTLDRVLNLADLRQFLFNEAIHPAIVVRYRKTVPDIQRAQIEYWSPKVTWTSARAEIVPIAPPDRRVVRLIDLLDDLGGPDAPQTWNQLFWASPRELRLLDRLSLYSRLRDRIRSSSNDDEMRRWVIAEGFQPLGRNDDAEKAKKITLPSRKFVPATSRAIDLFLLPHECEDLPSDEVTLRQRSNTNTTVFKAPHVLIGKGFQRIAFAGHDVSFRHALRGIHGPEEDRDQLVFLSAFLRSSLAKFFLFHTSSNWGVYRPEVHVEEILRLPMPLPEELEDTDRARAIIKRVAAIVDDASRQAQENFLYRTSVVEKATLDIEPLIEEYFEIQPSEKLLIRDALNITIPSIQPTQKNMPVPTVLHTNSTQRKLYIERLCNTLNRWAPNTGQKVSGDSTVSDALGIGVVVLEKVNQAKGHVTEPVANDDLLKSLDRLRKIVSTEQGTFDPFRNLMIFDRNKLYIIKLIGQRFWTETAALNDADEIVGSILMHSSRQSA